MYHLSAHVYGTSNASGNTYSVSCVMPGFVPILVLVSLRLDPSYIQSTFIESSRHVLERALTTVEW